MAVRKKKLMTIESSDRYTRLKIIKYLNLDKIKNAKVMVLGAGAVGNEVLKNLALFGVGNIMVVDFDTIDKTNLSRSVLFRSKDAEKNALKSIVAAKRAKEINPDCNFAALNADICYDIGLGIYRRMDAIVCCLDSRFARLMLNRYCYLLNKPWINCGILDVEGTCTVYKPGINDYESELSEMAWKMLKARMGCPDVARAYFKEGTMPTTPLSASIIGAVQVSEALKLIHGYEDQLLAGTEFRFNLKNNQFDLIDCKYIDGDSKSDARISSLLETKLSADSTVDQLKKYIKRKFGTNDYEVILRNPVVTKVKRESDNKLFNILVNESNLANYLDKSKIRGIGNEDGRNRIFIEESIDKITPLLQSSLTLNQMGVPYLDILEVRTANQGTHYLELTGDTAKLTFK